jgi:hypothetical protein
MASKEINMYVKDIVNLVKSGKFPVVRFTEDVDEVTDGLGESVISNGMLAKIIQVKENTHSEGWFELTFDLSIAREHNIALLTYDWFLLSEERTTTGRKTGTAMEAGILKEDMITENTFQEDILFPCEFVEEESLLARYLKYQEGDPSCKVTYVAWLEKELRLVEARELGFLRNLIVESEELICQY